MSISSRSWMPHLDSPASIRRFLAAAALCSVTVLIYASLIPLDYTPLSWDETWERWLAIPWFNLKLFNRADWVANALVVLPSGILAAAAVDWGRTRRWPLLVAAPLISLFLAAVVIAIEHVQVWFPPRTVSLNDIAAGCIGAALGPPIWLAIGRTVEFGITRFLTLPRFEDRLKWLCLAYLVFTLVYCVLPLDVVTTRAEWQVRLDQGNIDWNPFAGDQAALEAAKGLVLGALRMGPLGLLLALAAGTRFARWSLLLLPIMLELVQLPMYSKHVATLEVIGGWLGGGLGYLLGRNLHCFRRIVERPAAWGLAWIVVFAAVLSALLLRHDELLRDPTEIAHRFWAAWELPLVKYYAGSEYNAYTNMLMKIGLFALLGAIAFGWRETSSRPAGYVVFWLTLVAVVVTAFTIELLQVFLPPLVPDISDAFTYLLGYFAGYQVTRILWGKVPPSPGLIRQLEPLLNARR